jgi:hypothetical protein
MQESQFDDLWGLQQIAIPWVICYDMFMGQAYLNGT